MIIARLLFVLQGAGYSCMRGRQESKWETAGSAGGRHAAESPYVGGSPQPSLSTGHVWPLRPRRHGERGHVIGMVPIQLLNASAAMLLVGCEAVDTALWPENNPEEKALTSESQPPAEVALNPPEIGREPYVTIRFHQPNVAFEEPLAQAVVAALQRKPEVAVDVLLTMPSTDQTGAGDNIERVLQVITEAGVPASRITLWSVSATEYSFHEVNVFVR